MKAMCSIYKELEIKILTLVYSCSAFVLKSNYFIYLKIKFLNVEK